jgi:hypothetical protein
MLRVIAMDLEDWMMDNPMFYEKMDAEPRSPNVMEAYLELASLSKKELHDALQKHLPDVAPHGVSLSLRRKKELFLYALLCAEYMERCRDAKVPTYHAWRISELRKRVENKLGMSSKILKDMLAPLPITRMTFAHLAVLLDIHKHQEATTTVQRILRALAA